MSINLFCKSTNNAFSLDKYRNNEIFLIGDQVEVRNYFFFKKKGVTIGLVKPILAGVDKFDVEKLKIKVNLKIKNYCPKKVKVLHRGKYLPYDTIDNRDFWIEEIKKDPLTIFENINHESFRFVSEDFRRAIFCVKIKQTEYLALDYLNRCLRRGRYIIENDLLLPEVTDPRFVRNTEKVNLFKSFAYSMAFISNRPECNKLIEAANLIKVISSKTETPPSDWWGATQDFYLSAIRVLIIADELDMAREFIKSKRSFSKHLEQKKMLTKILKKNSDSKKNAQLKKDCYDFLEYTYYNIGSYSSCFGPGFFTFIEWNAIYYKHFISTDNTIDWNYVFNSLKDFKIVTNQ